MILEGAPVTVKSSMQKTVALSVTKAELMAGVTCAQDMLYARKSDGVTAIESEVANFVRDGQQRRS